jgi:hypothetical protein
MSTDIEQRLKSQLDRVPVRLRPELAGEAHRSFRRHRVIRRSAAVTGTAIAVALAVSAGTGSVPFSADAQRPAPATSRLPVPADGLLPPAGFEPPAAPDSLTPQQAAKDIFVRRETTSGPRRAAGVTFVYGDDNRTISYGTDGAPQYDYSLSVRPGHGGTATFAATSVRYSDRGWMREQDTASTSAAGSGAADSLCSVAQNSGLDNEDPALLMKGAASLVTCPGLTVTRGLPIGGVDAITVATPRWGKTMWLNATTYLPIRVVTMHPNPTDIIQYGYLPPTPANLRYLTAVIPPGFTRTPPPRGVPPGPQVPVEPWAPPPGVTPPFGLQPVPAPDGLTAAQAKGYIEWVRTTTDAVPASDTLTDTVFQYKSASRDLTYYPGGKPWDDSQTSVVRGTDGKVTSYDTVVLYDKRTVSRTVTGTGPATRPSPQTCGTAQQTGLADINYQATPDAARSLLTCSGMTIAHGKTIDGISAITIAHASETMWVNATTYLPIKIVIVSPKGSYPPAGFNGAASPGETIEFSWLPPTPANLAYVGIPIPPGFKHVS